MENFLFVTMTREQKNLVFLRLLMRDKKKKNDAMMTANLLNPLIHVKL